MKTYHIHTIGCQMNQADSERIAAYLESCGLTQIPEADRADLSVLTTCGVRQSAEDRAGAWARQLKKKNPNGILVLTGCLSERSDVIKRLGKIVDIWLPTAALPGLAKQLGLGPDLDISDYLSIKPKLSSMVSAFVPIGNGCNNFCSYCVVPYARHREKYRPHREILAEVADLVERGGKEITLIAQNVNSYADGSVDFSDLLAQVAALPGDFWVRFATSHPKDMSAKLIKTVADCGKLCDYIHLPAQAGNDQVLRRMNRNYSREHYLGLVAQIRALMPRAGLTTDIIVGFPGETEEQFQDTVELFRRARFDMAYIARYSPRPGTAAYQFADDIDQAEKKRREAVLMAELRQSALANGQPYLGQCVRVLIEGRNKKGEYLGKTSAFKSVKIKAGQGGWSGKFASVLITKVRDFGWEGELVENGN